MALLVSFSTFSQKDEKNTKKEKTYSEVITDKAVTDNGLFDVHKIDDKYYYEINDSLLGRDMLMVTRIVKMATELPLNRHKMSEQVLKWEKFDNNICLSKHLIQSLLMIHYQLV